VLQGDSSFCEQILDSKFISHGHLTPTGCIEKCISVNFFSQSHTFVFLTLNNFLMKARPFNLLSLRKISEHAVRYKKITCFSVQLKKSRTYVFLIE
jgi:hypothetical protein